MRKKIPQEIANSIIELAEMLLPEGRCPGAICLNDEETQAIHRLLKRVKKDGYKFEDLNELISLTCSCDGTKNCDCSNEKIGCANDSDCIYSQKKNRI